MGEGGNHRIGFELLSSNPTMFHYANQINCKKQ